MERTPVFSGWSREAGEEGSGWEFRGEGRLIQLDLKQPDVAGQGRPSNQ